MRELVRRLSKGPTHVFLLVENRLVREALDRLFRKRSDLRVVGQGCCTDAVGEILNSQCDTVVLDDLHSASLHRLRLLDQLQTTGPVGVALVDMQEDEKQFLAAVRSGV